MAVQLEVFDAQGRDGDEDQRPTILLQVSYPPSYPDVGPDLDLSNDPDAPRHPLLDIATDKAELLESLDPMIEESLGMAMVFTLVTTLKDKAESLISERQNQAQEAKEVESRKAEAEENKRFEGTKVTRQSFLDWRTGFRAEMQEQEKLAKEEAEAEEKKKGVRVRAEEKKMTGRQLWEKGLAGKVDDADLEADGDDALAGIDHLKLGTNV